MKRLLLLLLLLVGGSTSAAEALDLSFDIHGRTPLHQQPANSPGYGLLGAAVFVGEPVLVTVTALNVPTNTIADWTRLIQWSVTTEDGAPVAVTIERDTDSPIKTPYSIRLTRPDALFANFRFSTLPPGRYIVALRWTDPDTDEKGSAERRRLAIYRGDEGPLVRSFFLREQAHAALKDGTSDSYQKARALLLQAAEGNGDPSIYEELADASAPWATPDETAAYYLRSLDIAKKNLEKHYGPQKAWPEKALSLYRPRARKVDAFRELLPYYKNNFSQVRVVVEPDGGGGKFVVVRRKDGARLRVVDPSAPR